MNGQRARGIRRSYGVKHVRLARLRRGEHRLFPRFLANYFEVTRRISEGRF